MSNRSLFPEGVEIHQKQMTYESASRMADMQDTLVNATTRGIISGLEVTVNSGDDTRVDVAAGVACAPDGRYMELPGGVTGLAASTTLGAVSYVCMVYDEVQSDPEASRFSGVTRPTKATVQPRVVVLTQAAYNALPELTGQLSLSSNTKDRITVLATVTGTGVGFVSGDITTADAYISALNATQPTNISGVTIIRVGVGTPTGAGTLTYTSGSNSITWAAFGETAGASETLSSSTTYTLYSYGGSTILIDVGMTLLPASNASDTITISDIYDATLPRFSAVDAQHRSKIGSGVVSDRNPHGLTLDDLSPDAAGTLEIHQDVMHANGFGNGSSPTVLDVSINTVPTIHTLAVQQLSSTDSIYINGKRITSIVNTLAPSSPTDVNPATYQLSISQDGELSFTPLVQMSSTYFADKIQVLDVVGVSSGAYELRYSISGLIEFGAGGSFGTKTAQTPSVDGLVRAYHVNGLGYVDLWVKAAVPGATTTVTLTVTQVNADESLVFATVPWSGSANGDLGYGFGAANAPNGVFYKRVYGNLSADNIRTDSGISDAAHVIRDAFSDGLVYETRSYHGHTNNEITFATAQATQHIVTPAWPNTIYTGGVCIIGGKRFNVSRTSISLNAGTNKIFITDEGAITVSLQSWAQLSATYENRPYLPLYEIPVSGVTIGTTVDLRTFIGYKRNAEMGVVGLDGNKEVSLTPVQSGNRTALSATGYGTGSGVKGYTHSSAPDSTAAIVGTAQGTNNVGVEGRGTGNESGVYGFNSATGVGVSGVKSGVAGSGVRGLHTGSGAGVGVYGEGSDLSSTSVGVWGQGGSDGVDGAAGVVGFGGGGSSGGAGVSGTGGPNAPGVIGIAGAGGYGVQATGGMYTDGDVVISGSGNVKHTPARTANIFISAWDFTWSESTDANIPFVKWITGGIPYMRALTGAAYKASVQLRIPAGCTITNMKACFENIDEADRAPSIVLYRNYWTSDLAFYTSSQIQVVIPTIPTANTTKWYGIALSHTTQVNSLYYLAVGMPSATLGDRFGLLGAIITYTYDTVTPWIL